jgi:hypothetical protein
MLIFVVFIYMLALFHAPCVKRKIIHEMCMNFTQELLCFYHYSHYLTSTYTPQHLHSPTNYDEGRVPMQDCCDWRFWEVYNSITTKNTTSTLSYDEDRSPLKEVAIDASRRGLQTPHYTNTLFLYSFRLKKLVTLEISKNYIKMAATCLDLSIYHEAVLLNSYLYSLQLNSTLDSLKRNCNNPLVLVIR